MAEKKQRQREKAHCLVVPAAAQGHFTPLLQFSKRLIPKQIRVTLALTRFIHSTITFTAESGIHLDTISDGYDDGGFKAAEDAQHYFDSFRRVGSKTLTELIQKQSELGHPVHCIIYDASMPWFLDVAKRFGLIGCAFLTQSCAVDAIYYHVREGAMEHPRDLVIAGLPPLERSDLPSFIWDGSKFPEFLDAHLRQFSNDDADWVFCNTVYELEQEAVDWLSKQWTVNFRTIGPTIPSMYLNNQIPYDNDYGISIFNPDTQTCMNWLHSKPYMSVVYVSFGSLARLSPQQMEELCFGLNNSNHYFLWVVRDYEISKLHATNFSNGVIVSWCPQLQVLASGKVGCFVTHCGWNSTLEALSLGVPMVAMPQCGDQFTNAKFIQDVWGTGVRAEEADDEKGMVIIKREEIERCIREVMEGEEMRKNAGKWEKIVKEAALEGGTSDKNTEDFAAALIRFAQT